MESKTFTVPNISCGHCVHTVQMEVGDLAGVKRVKAFWPTRGVCRPTRRPGFCEQLVESLCLKKNK